MKISELLIILNVMCFQFSFAQTNLKSVNLDGINDYINVPNILSNESQGSVEFWVNVDDWGSGTGGSYLFSGTNGGINSTGPDRINLGVHPAHGYFPGELLFGIYNGGWYFVHSNLSIDDSEYHHIVGTWGSQGLKLFVDGSLAGSLNYTGGVPFISNTFVGTSAWMNTNVDGRFDEFRFWDYQLDLFAVQEYMQCSPPFTEPGLLGYWDIEEGTGTITHDQTTNNNHATLVNGIQWSNLNHESNCCISNPITSQPQNLNLNIGDNAVFSTVDALTSATYQWQIDDGTGYVDLTNTGQYSGVNSESLTVSTLNMTNNNTWFRNIITSNTNCVDTSEAALLNISEKGMSTNSFTEDGIDVISNLNSDIINIFSNRKDIQNIEVYSSLGQIIQSIDFKSETIIISKESLGSKGVFILLFRNSNQEIISRKKIVHS